MTKNVADPIVFRQAASQSSAVASSLRKLAERSRKKRKTLLERLEQPTIAEWSAEYDSDACVSSSVDSSDRPSFRMQRGVFYDTFPSTSYKKRRNLRPVVMSCLLACGLTAFGIVFGPPMLKAFVVYWKSILMILGGALIGAGLILAITQVEKSPLRNIQPPDDETEDPLQELENLAKRSVSRLKTAYRIQIGLICAVAAALFITIGWSIIMVTNKQLMYATTFGSSGVGMLVLARWKWQPFDRVAQARKLADDADILATGLRLRIVTISEIQDPNERSRAQWEAVTEYVKYS